MGKDEAEKRWIDYIKASALNDPPKMVYHSTYMCFPLVFFILFDIIYMSLVRPRPSGEGRHGSFFYVFILNDPPKMVYHSTGIEEKDDIGFKD